MKEDIFRRDLKPDGEVNSLGNLLKMILLLMITGDIFASILTFMELLESTRHCGGTRDAKMSKIPSSSPLACC